MINGERCAMMSGICLMPLWCVANLALRVLLELQQIHSLTKVIDQDNNYDIILCNLYS